MNFIRLDYEKHFSQFRFFQFLQTIMNQPSQRTKTDYPILKSKNRKYDIEMASDMGYAQYEASTPNQELRYKARADTKRMFQNSHRTKNFKDLQFDERKSDIVQYTVRPRKQVSPQFAQNQQSDISNVQERYKKINKYMQKEIQNLKEQNQQLFNKCKQISKKKEKYKQMYQHSQQQLQLAIEERQTYKKKADQLMRIVEKDMRAFQKKLYLAKQPWQKNLQNQYTGKEYSQHHEVNLNRRQAFYQPGLMQQNQLKQVQYEQDRKKQTKKFQHSKNQYFSM